METRLGRAEELPFESQSIELVLSGGLLEHFPDPKPVLREMLRVLRPGGVLYADVVPRKPSLYRLHELKRMRSSEWIEPGVYESALGPRGYKAALQELGCTTIETMWCGVYPAAIRHLGPFRSATSRIAEIFDGTNVAAQLGWYFMLAATRPQKVE